MKNRNKQSYRIEAWDPFKPGDIIEMKGAFFRIHRINPLARQIILVGIPDLRPKKKEEPSEKTPV